MKGKIIYISLLSSFLLTGCSSSQSGSKLQNDNRSITEEQISDNNQSQSVSSQEKSSAIKISVNEAMNLFQ